MYRVKHAKTGLFIREVANPKAKYAGDTSAYWRYTLNDDEATDFKSYSEAEMPGIMLSPAPLIIVDANGETVTLDQAKVNDTFHSATARPRFNMGSFRGD